MRNGRRAIWEKKIIAAIRPTRHDRHMYQLTLSRLNGLVYRVLTPSGDHVGNLKFIAGAWKFKAIGYDTQGDVMPGGGPLTDHHNRVFATLDEAVINERLLGPGRVGSSGASVL